jgi:murein DD-endopeptidase MepM/ murein hydrolase activator NlpD
LSHTEPTSCAAPSRRIKADLIGTVESAAQWMPNQHKATKSSRLFSKSSKKPLAIALGVAGIIGGLAVFAPQIAVAVKESRNAFGLTQPASQARAAALQEVALALPSYDTVASAEVAPLDVAPDWQRVVARSGETLSDIFQRAGLGSNAMHEVLALNADTQKLTRVFPGDEFRFLIDDQGLEQLSVDIDERSELRIERSDDGYKTSKHDQALEFRTREAAGQIRSSLFRDAGNAGLSDQLILDMVEIFGFDVDFALDLRPGDRFSVLFDEAWRNGERLRSGEILAATFVNQGKTYSAYRMTLEDGSVQYFTAEGRSLKKGFLRTPVKFSRISSGFSIARRHPILGSMRAHKGVDYAAPTGTAIRAAGDGTITFRGWKSGYGNVIEVQHWGGYTTLYGHMSRFDNDFRVGNKVSQGDVIGYVGMTGLATGPHLHYEFRINGQHRDPVTVELPRSEPLKGREYDKFIATTAPLVARLAQLDGLRVVASAE